MSKLTLGLRNTLDSKEKLKADAKYKSNNNNNNDNNNNYFAFESGNLQGDDDYVPKGRIQSFQVMEDYDGSNNNNDEDYNNNDNGSIYFASSSTASSSAIFTPSKRYK